jgi:hypothetical protein
VFNIERNWATAMNLKKLLSEKKVTERVKYHVIKKLKKATQCVNQLVQAAVTSLDKASNVEVKAYADFITGQ